LEEGRQEETEIIVTKDMLQILESIHISLHECVPKKHFSTTTKRIGLTLMCPYRAHTNHTPEFFFLGQVKRVPPFSGNGGLLQCKFPLGPTPGMANARLSSREWCIQKEKKITDKSTGKTSTPSPPNDSL